MDSVTQIVLGAAVGEAVLGRKVGNRSMLWGGIAGTLPDLDVLSSVVTDPMSALVYHRAFTHSMPFAVLAAPLLGLAVHRLYGGDKFRDKIGDRWLLPLLAVVFYVLLVVGSYLMPIEVYRIPVIAGLICLVFFGVCGVFMLRHRLRKVPSANENASFGGWTLLFFMAVVTHPLLDCFTAYGTQFFQPFTKSRLAWNTISVADPLYTLPFLLLLILAGRKLRGSRIRKRLNTAGLIVSSAYLLLTVVNHFNVDSALDDSLEARGISKERRTLSPTILNNILWSATVEDRPGHFQIGQYSLLDEERKFGPFIAIEGHHDWLTAYEGDRDLEVLRWFSKGYYGVVGRPDGTLQISDLRYGLIGEDPEDPASYIFSWQVDTSAGPLRVVQQFAGPQRDREEMMGDLWDRMMGE